MVLKELLIPTKLVKDGEMLMEYLVTNSEHLPDVLFLDINMPRKNGSECLEEIKHSEKLKGIPVIMYSTSFDENIADQLYKNGAHYYIRKTDLAEIEVILIEAEIAKRVLSALNSVNALGKQVPFNCPGCGGVLWQIDGADARFRCHTGHAYTSETLLAEQSNKIEETMWTALRMFEERKNLLTTMAKKQSGRVVAATLERATLSDVHIKRIRLMLQSNSKALPMTYSVKRYTIEN